jgi:hypothetical protein
MNVKPGGDELQQMITNGSGETAPVSASKKISKEVRYKWSGVGDRGKMDWVSKHALSVDRTYQRPLNDAKRLEIASDFNWVAFGVITVARRANEQLVAVDGQHRLYGALSRDDITDVPVIIHDLKGVKNEAEEFLVINSLRRALNGIEKFSAQKVSGDPVALAVEDMVVSSGRAVGVRGGGGLLCVRAMTRAMTTDAAVMRAIWPLIIEISIGESIDQRMLTALFALERRLVDAAGAKRSLTEADNRRKLVEAGYSKVMRAIGEASAYYNKGGDVVWARGVLNILNYKKQNRLSLKGDTEA